jgi:TrwC relaxase
LSVSWGSDARYLTSHAEEGRERDRAARDNYYLRAAEHGEPAGVWHGRGAESLGLTGEVSRAQMLGLYNELKHPVSGEQSSGPTPAGTRS